jgi:exopolysaccharide biosynthesis WecB/TagA/CpsF family protein
MIKNCNTVSICGVKINNITFEEAVREIDRHIHEKRPSFIVTPNLDHIIKLQKDAEFRKIYNAADLVLVDGVPILWASKFLGTPLKERIAGSDLFPALCSLAAKKGYKLFLLGGRTQGGVLLVAKILKKRYPGLSIVGAYSPRFGFEKRPEENKKIIQKIKDAAPDILLVGLGAPKQEKWIYAFKDEYNVPVSIGIGISFHFVSGRVRRAPRGIQKLGLEWFWRLMAEPGRLWKRYLIDDMKFFWLVLKQKIRAS